MDEGRHPCSDEDVDAALAIFRSEVRVPEASVRRARERLTSVIERDAAEVWAPAPLRVVPRVAVDAPPPRRRTLRPAASGLVAAAAVAALVVGVLTVSSRVGGGLDASGAAGVAPVAGPVLSTVPARADEVLTRAA
ncbi:MAG TPA: hypothetical protein VF667_07545, partial [Pseudonocardia sp.]